MEKELVTIKLTIRYLGTEEKFLVKTELPKPIPYPQGTEIDLKVGSQQVALKVINFHLTIEKGWLVNVQDLDSTSNISPGLDSEFMKQIQKDENWQKITK